MKTFVRVVEVWVPDRGGTLLEFGGGWYGDARTFGAVSRRMCFGRGEGLPGQAWEQRRPIMLTDLSDPMFRRSQAAAAEGLSCGAAWPVFAGDELRAVLLLFCGDDEAHVGAVELWHHDAENSYDMTFDAGYYGGTAEVFEYVSRHTAFRRGTGLPGLVWESGLPVFMPDLGKGTKFIRAESAQQVGINRGLGLPCPVPGDDTYVMTFLSALATPIVRRLELWLPDAGGGALQRAGGFCESQGLFGGAGDHESIALGEGLLGRTLASGTPGIAQPASDEPGAVGFAARGAGLKAVLSLPVHRDGRVASVVAWYF